MSLTEVSSSESRRSEEEKSSKRDAQALANFDKLPDDAIVPDRVAAEILGTSIWTLRRNNPVPARQVSERRYGRRVGDLRALSRGQAA